MIGSDFLLALVAHLAWMEGNDYGLNAQLAIIFCIRNRLAAGWCNGNLGEILQDAYCWRWTQGEKMILVPDVRNPEVQNLLSYVTGIMDNTIQDRLTLGATYWGNNMTENFKKVAQVGSLNLWSGK